MLKFGLMVFIALLRMSMSVLEKFMQHAKRVTFTSTMESPYEHAPNELDLFHENARNYRTLIQIANENNIAIEPPLLLRTPHRFQPLRASLFRVPI